MRIFQTLIDFRIVRWENRIGYYIDEALRFPIVTRMKNEKPQLWHCLHEFAAEYYRERDSERAQKHKQEAESVQSQAEAIS